MENWCGVKNFFAPFNTSCFVSGEAGFRLHLSFSLLIVACAVLSFFLSTVICDLGDNFCLQAFFVVVLGAVWAMAGVSDDCDFFLCVELCTSLVFFLAMSPWQVATPPSRLTCVVSVVKQSDRCCIKRLLKGCSVSVSNSAKMLLYGFDCNCTSCFFGRVYVSDCGTLDISWLG